MSQSRVPVQREGQRRKAARDEGKSRTFWRSLGPGIITGAADDDPSGIATYSIAGAQFGGTLLWTALATWPLMAAVQTMCARVGMVTGQGLMSALRLRFPRKILVVAAAALFIANTLNVGSDLSGMADAAEMLTGISSHIYVVVFAIALGWATIRVPYQAIARILKWLALVLVAYILAAFSLHPRWSEIFAVTFTPRIPESRDGWGTIVAILGTTISPYLFFWQASNEVEEEKSLGRRRIDDRKGASKFEIRRRKEDIGIGTFASNVAMYFIILTTGLTLHTAGITHIQTSREVAEALEPLAGRFASLLYTLGLIGTGALAIPTLAGSAAYALAEVFDWKEGLAEKPTDAPAFYGVVAVSMGFAVLLDYANVNAVQALYLTAVINGLLAPFLLVGILMVATNRKIMNDQPSSLLGRTVVGVAATAMFAAAIGLFIA
jgi:NRAMP (natural resistance-associated macrophage protein)-like metal ion transporter